MSKPAARISDMHVCPKGTFNYTGAVDGERLALTRAFNADGNGGAGYMFVTPDRKDKLDLSKEYTFSDKLLFEHGLIQIFQDVANKIDAGQL
ncbi:MAG: hypothetical protein K6L73_06380 [Cellvibrionaceae bacterium]